MVGLIGSDSPLASYCDVPLFVRTLNNTNVYTPTTSRIAALVVIDILSTSVALRRDPEHKKQVARMKQRLQEFRSVSGI